MIKKIIKKEGFVRRYSFWVWSKSDLENGKFLQTKFLIENNKVYYFPYVTLAFVDGSKKVRIFKTFSEAVQFATRISKTIPLTLEVVNDQYTINFNDPNRRK